MDPYLVLAFVLLVFVLLFGGLTLLRREPLSARFAAETLLVGGAILGLSWLLRRPWSPVLFFVILYLVAMRARLVTEVANLLAQRGRLPAALRLYELALRLATDSATRATVRVNQGAALLLGRRLPLAIAALQEALAGPGLGIKQEAACHYNLGLAYLRQGETGLGQAELREVGELLPGSIYARHAELALRSRSEGGEAPPPQA